VNKATPAASGALIADYKHAALLATKAATSLHMLLRNMRMYDPDNAVFVEPLAALQSVINEVVDRDGRFALQVIGTVLVINGVAVRVDFGVLEVLRALTDLLRERGLGGIEVEKTLEIHELKSFLRGLANADEDGGALAETVGVKGSRWADLRAQLDERNAQEIDASRKIDRDKYALTVAARAITWLRRLVTAIDGRTELPALAPLNGVLRDLVELAETRPRALLRLSRARSVDDTLIYHGVNTCLITLVLGAELGLSRDELQDAGRAAILHEVGMRGADRELLIRRGSLTPEQRATVDSAPIVAARTILRMRPLDVSALRSMVIVKEVKEQAHADPQPGVLARIVRVASTFDALTSEGAARAANEPEVALELMRTAMKAWFDQDVVELLAVIVARSVGNEKPAPVAGVS